MSMQIKMGATQSDFASWRTALGELPLAAWLKAAGTNLDKVAIGIQNGWQTARANIDVRLDIEVLKTNFHRRHLNSDPGR